MEILRIVVSGAVGAGKSTFIRTISEIEVVDTDKKATDETAELKATTTVAMDFGRLTIGANQSLHLYGTPGQPRFDYMWDILIQKAHAFILLVDAHRPEHFRYSRKILSFMNRRVQIPYLVGLTHSDCQDAWEVEDVALALGMSDEDKHQPFIAINPTQRNSVAEALILLMEELSKWG
jgi:uncharacterized protein